MSDATGKNSFFRQSAWMIGATLAAGTAMMLVHPLVSKRLGDAAFAEFKALMSTFYVISAASGGLWTLFGQQSAAAITPEQIRNVAATARRVCGWMAALWLVLAVGLWWWQSTLVQLWKLSNPAALWATWGLGLVSLMVSVFRGMLQGRQQFLELGWMSIFDGCGRLVAVWVVVTLLGGLAAGVMTAAVVGTLAALILGLFGVRHWLLLPGGEVQWGPWLRGFIPLAASAAALQLMQQYDQIFWQALIPKSEIDTWKLGSRYLPAQTIGFALTQFVVPLAMVMMPRLSRSAATGEKSDALKMGLLSTAILVGLAAIAATLFPALPLQVMFFNKPENWTAAPLVPWFAWAMAMFAIGGVFLSDLFARRQFTPIWGVVVLCAGYIGTLQSLAPRLRGMEPMDAYRLGLQILLLTNVLYLIFAASVSHWSRRATATPKP